MHASECDNPPLMVTLQRKGLDLSGGGGRATLSVGQGLSMATHSLWRLSECKSREETLPSGRQTN